MELLLLIRENDERPDSAEEAPTAGELGVAEPSSDKSLSIVVTLTTLGGNHPNLEGSLLKRPSHHPWEQLNELKGNMITAATYGIASVV